MTRNVYYYNVYCSICFEFLGMEQTSLDDTSVKEAVMPFGKYKGKLLSEVPKHYIQWVLGNCSPRKDLAAAMEYYARK